MGAFGFLHAVKRHSPGTFALFRIGFGTWLAWQFAALAPWAGELFSSDGVPGHAAWAGWFGGAWWWAIWCVAGAVLGILLAAGWRRIWVAPALWLAWAVLYNRNPLLVTPATAYVGFLLIMLALVPEGEAWRWRGSRTPDTEWAMPLGVFAGAWFLMAANYSCIGLAKMGSPSWRNGTAFWYVLHDPMARPGFWRDLALGLPAWVLALITWGTTVAQAAFLPLCATPRGRKWAWSLMVLMHFGLLGVMNFTELTAGMLWLHVFTFDPEWIPARGRSGRQAVLLYDGECGLCNAVTRFLAREDTTGVLRFAPLQGRFAQEALKRCGLPRENFDSLVFLPDADGEIYRLRTAGALEVFDALGGIWRPVGRAARLVPGPIRDLAYRLVARLRYRLFGPYVPVPLPEALARHFILE